MATAGALRFAKCIACGTEVAIGALVACITGPVSCTFAATPTGACAVRVASHSRNAVDCARCRCRIVVWFAEALPRRGTAAVALAGQIRSTEDNTVIAVVVCLAASTVGPSKRIDASTDAIAVTTAMVVARRGRQAVHCAFGAIVVGVTDACSWSATIRIAPARSGVVTIAVFARIWRERTSVFVAIFMGGAPATPC
jgi:hypothetical protein